MALPIQGMLVDRITGTTHATPGTRTTHTHNKSGYTPVFAVFMTTAAADDLDNGGGAVSLTAVSSTTITVKSSAASTTFHALIYFTACGHTPITAMATLP